MKQIFNLVLFIILVQSTTAQKLTSKTLKQISLSNHKKIITQALNYNDTQTVINSLHHIINLEGTKSSYKDSLAITYFNVKKYRSCHLLTKELLASKPNNLPLLEISAVSLQNLNRPKEAITAFEKLFALTNNMAFGYQLANLQYGLKRLAEAQITIASTIQCNEIENATIPFPLNKNKKQQVPLKVAAYHLQGLIAYDLNEYTAASIAFAEATKRMPEFALATQNANTVLLARQNDKISKRSTKE